MNEEELQLMVARAREAEGTPAQPPPGLLDEARTACGRRRRLLTLGAAGAVAAVIAAAVAVSQLLPDHSDEPVPAEHTGELEAHGGPCPPVLPTPTDDDGYGFGASSAADSDPRFATPDVAWVCRYGSHDVAPARHNGAFLQWRLDHAPRRLEPLLLPEVGSRLDDVTPLNGSGDRSCPANLGPRYALVTSSGGDLTGVVVDDFGCGEVRLTDDPFVTAPGDPQHGATVPGVLMAPGLAETVSGWWDTSPADVEDSGQPRELRVTCTEDGPVVDSTTVVATPAGVVLRVDSRLPKGSYLNYAATNEVGGDNIDELTSPVTYQWAPGELTLSCSSGPDPTEPVEIGISDPDGYWRTATLADFGCARGATPSWKVSNGTGTTPGASVDSLLDQFSEEASDRTNFTAEPAPTGYSGAETQTWIGYRRGTPYLSIRVTGSESSFTANPDVLCAKS